MGPASSHLASRQEHASLDYSTSCRRSHSCTCTCCTRGLGEFVRDTVLGEQPFCSLRLKSCPPFESHGYDFARNLPLRPGQNLPGIARLRRERRGWRVRRAGRQGRRAAGADRLRTQAALQSRTGAAGRRARLGLRRGVAGRAGSRQCTGEGARQGQGGRQALSPALPPARLRHARRAARRQRRGDRQPRLAVSAPRPEAPLAAPRGMDQAPGRSRRRRLDARADHDRLQAGGAGLRGGPCRRADAAARPETAERARLRHICATMSMAGSCARRAASTASPRRAAKRSCAGSRPADPFFVCRRRRWARPPEHDPESGKNRPSGKDHAPARTWMAMAVQPLRLMRTSEPTSPITPQARRIHSSVATAGLGASPDDDSMEKPTSAMPIALMMAVVRGFIFGVPSPGEAI